MAEQLIFDRPSRVVITNSRWDVHVDVLNAQGEMQRFVASADSARTQGDGIWFDTKEETDAYDARGGF